VTADRELWRTEDRALRRAVLLAFFPASLTHFTLTGGRVIVALDLLRSGQSGFVVGLVVGMFGLIPALGSVLIGRLIDRHGARHAARWGVGVTLAGTVSAAAGEPLIGAVPALVIAGLLIGAGASVTFLMQQQVIARAVPSERRMGFLATTGVLFSLTHFLGPLYAGLSIDHLGMRESYRGLLLIAALACVAAAFVVSHDAAPVRARSAGARLFDLLADREMRAIYLLSALVLACWDVHAILLPIYGTSIGLSATAIGSILATFSSAIVVARIAIPFAVRHMGEWRVLSASLALSGCCFLVYPAFSTPIALGTLAFLMGLAAGFNQPLVSGMLMERAPAGRSGEALGLRNAIASGEQLGIPMLAGALTGLFGIFPIFLGTAALALAGSAFGMRVQRRKPHSPRNDA